MLIITLHDDTKNAIKTMKLPQKYLLNSQKLKTQLIFLFYLKRYIRSIFQNVFYTDFLIINRQLFLQIDPNISDFLIVNLEDGYSTLKILKKNQKVMLHIRHKNNYIRQSS